MDLIIDVTPKPGPLVITEDDAIAFADFLTFVSAYCSDKSERDGRRWKSKDLLERLDRMRGLCDKLIDEPEIEQGTYWTPYHECQPDEIQPILLQEIGNRTGVKLYSANLFDIPSGAPIGHIELALDTEVKEACGVFFFPRGFEEEIVGPEWLAASPEMDDTIQSFVDALPGMKSIQQMSTDTEARSDDQA
ncbi:hypothetical protein [Rhizobium leucaenae]|uniref:hypothetical protein n=1 Tax=Rhizobium leucaenae TaxID=29450 RepID=UPI00160CABDE|nr:hypothetical protein [Rhizobium leucaenae]MBB6304690.1 hypothetical protein [Rhizobium leucaenae]